MVSTTALFALVLGTVIATIVVFIVSTSGGRAGRVTHAEERNSLVNNADSARPAPVQKKEPPKQEAEEPEYRAGADDDMDEEGGDDGIE